MMTRNFPLRSRAIRMICILALLTISISSMAQFQNVGIGTLSPDSSAILDINAADKGILIPRLTAGQIATMPKMRNGLLIYNEDKDLFQYYNGIGWNAFPSWNTNNNDIYNTNSGKIGIGTQNPSRKLTISRASEDAIGQLELRTEGGITSGNYDGLYFTQGADGSTPLGSYRLVNQSSGYPDLAFFTRNGSSTESEKMRLTNAGNLGIGTTNPSQKLTVSGSISATGSVYAGGAFNASWSGDNISIYRDATGGYIQTNNNEGIFLNNNGGNVLVTSGRVGIGTNNPKAPLHVVGTGDNINPTQIQYMNNGALTTNSSWAGTASAIFDNNVITDDAFIAVQALTFSDQRVKNIIGRSNSSIDLATLAEIEITDYSYIDSITQGNRVQKKVIAQQVEKVYPNAVSKMNRYIPNIYALASKVESGNEGLEMTMEKPHGLIPGNSVKWIDQSGQEHYSSVVRVISEVSFQLDESGEFTKAFIYGKEVDDFRTVDYDAIAMLNVSATQELYKLVKNLMKENTTLKNENTEVKADLKAIKAQLGMDAQGKK